MTEDRDMLPLVEGLRAWIGLGRGGRPISPATAWRWHRQGTRRPDGIRVHLAITRVGGRLYLRRADLDAYISACSAPAVAPATVPVPVPRADTAAVLERAAVRAFVRACNPGGPNPAPDAPVDDARRVATEETLRRAGIRAGGAR